MSHPLEEKVAGIRRRARRLVLWHGALAFLSVGILAAFAAGLADYLLRLRDPGLRVLASASALAAAAWAFFRFLYPAVTYCCSDVRVAQHIERRFPCLADRLSNAIAFLKQSPDDAKAGSRALREALIAQTTCAVEGLPVEECLDPRGANRAAWILLLVASMVGAACCLNSQASLLAARRLVWPLSRDVWPRRNQLVFTKSPAKLAAGEDLEVELLDARGRLPDDLQLQYVYADDLSRQIHSKPMNPLGDKAIGRLERVTRSLHYRAVGGDDDTMAWLPLQVAEPPRLSDLRIVLHAPAYTGLRPEESDRHIRAWEGTRVQLSGRVDKPLRCLSLETDSAGGRRTFPARLDGLRRGFSIPADPADPWILKNSGTYWFELSDREGYSAKELLRSQVYVQQDAPPTVMLTSPPLESQFTPDALVPVRMVVKDDLGIRQVELHAAGQHIEVYRGPADPGRDGTAPGGLLAERGVTQEVEYGWELSGMPGLKPGDTIEFRLQASDYKSQSGQSDVARITIISAEELQSRSGQREAIIAERLDEALRLQRAVRSQVASLENRLRQAGAWARDDVDYLQGAELNQRRVARMLGGDPDGVVLWIEALLGDLRNNRIDRSEASERLAGLLGETRRIAQEDLPRVQLEMTRALKSLRSARGTAAGGGPAEEAQRSGAAEMAAVIAPLAAAGRGQDRVIDTLERLLGKLSRWQGYRQLVYEVGQLRLEQQQIARETAAMPTAAQSVPALPLAARANLQRLAERQLHLAREFDRLQARMAAGPSEWATSDPLAATALGDAAEAARRLALAGAMREAAQRIGHNQIGQAMQGHQQVLRGLEELLDLLANRRERELDRVARNLRDASQELAAVHRRVAEAWEQLAKAGKAPAEFAARQEELARRGQALASRLAALLARESAALVGQAAEHLRSAAQATQPGQAAAAAARRAEQLLAQARERLEQEILALEADLHAAHVAQLRQAVAELASRQRALRDSTGQLPKLTPDDSPARKADFEAGCRALAARQRAIFADTEKQAEKLSLGAPLKFALLWAGRPMEQAASLLDQAVADERTLQLQGEAIQGLQTILDTLASTPRSADTGTHAPKAAESPPREPAAHAAQVRVLRALQLEINRRTQELAQLAASKKTLTDEEEQRFAELAADQGRLAELVARALGASLPGTEKSRQPPDRSLERELDEALEKAGIPGFSEKRP